MSSPHRGRAIPAPKKHAHGMPPPGPPGRSVVTIAREREAADRPRYRLRLASFLGISLSNAQIPPTGGRLRCLESKGSIERPDADSHARIGVCCSHRTRRGALPEGRRTCPAMPFDVSTIVERPKGPRVVREGGRRGSGAADEVIALARYGTRKPERGAPDTGAGWTRCARSSGCFVLRNAFRLRGGALPDISRWKASVTPAWRRALKARMPEGP